MVSSATPACKKAPEKSPFISACVFFKKPSVLSELERSAEEHIILPTFSAKYESTVADALRVAAPGFCWMSDQSMQGTSSEKYAS